MFNEHGYNSINLFELSNKLGISRGNLTYHFSDKGSLLRAISDEMWSKIEDERSKTIQLPSFENLHNEHFYEKIFCQGQIFIKLEEMVSDQSV